MRRVSIKLRIVMLILLIVAFALGVGLSLYARLNALGDMAIGQAQEIMLEGQRERLKLAVHSLAISLAKGLENITDEEAQAQYIRRMTYDIRFEPDKSAYFYAYRGTVCVSLPPLPERQGKDVGYLVDSNGVHFVQEFERVAKNGGGFVNYVFPRTGKQDQPKLGYAELIPGTDIWIGTGVYMDGIEAKKSAISSTIESMVTRSVSIIGGIALVLFILVVLPISMIFLKSIVGPLVLATRAAKQVASGDLSVKLEVHGSDEVSHLERALNSMVSSLSQTRTQIENKNLELLEKSKLTEQSALEAEQAKNVMQARAEGMLDAASKLENVMEIVTSASEELSAQIEQSKQGAQEQSQRVGETATAMEEMNSTVLEVAKSASQAADTSLKAKNKAEEGATIVKQVVMGIAEVQAQALGMKGDMTALGQQAQGIGQILNVISDIADQTNLLALNAAIEAARAGDAGRGFAVVADEVRKLAEKTMTATKEVGEAIHAIQDGTRKNIANVDGTVKKINDATELASKSGDTLGEIVTLVELTTDQVRSIATASNQQSSASEEISRSIEDVNRISLETTDAMSQSALAVSELANQAHILQNLIGSLQSEDRLESKGANKLLALK